MPNQKLIELHRSKIHGNGVAAIANIKKGTEIIEYKGKLRTHAEVDEDYGGEDTGHTFLFILNDTYVIDANVNGNVAKWINTSCDPNCIAYVIEDESGDPARDRVMIEALRDIKKGEELTYDYGITTDSRITAAEKKLWACHCGSPKCTGSMLKKSK